MTGTPDHFLEIQNQLLRLLSESGVSSQQLKNHLDGEEEQRDIGKLLQAGVDVSGDPYLCLRLGRRIKISNFGPLGFALMSCATLRQTLQLMVRYHPLLNQGISWQLADRANGIALRATTTSSAPNLHRYIVEIAVSALFEIGRSLVTEPVTGIALHLDYAAPQDDAAYQSFFALPIEFNQPITQVLFPSVSLDQPLRTTHSASHVMFQQQCEDLLRGLSRVDSATEAVRRILVHTGGKFPSLSAVASDLNMSERTLRRRLKSEMTNFRTICDDVRNILAQEFLSSTEMTVADITEVLGYAEPVSFRRAFIRWNNETPHAFRHRNA